MRDLSSPWMNTRFTRPRSMKSLTYAEPQAADRVLLMSAMFRLWALAFSLVVGDAVLRFVVEPVRPHREHPRVLRRRAQQLVARRHQLVVAGVVLVHQFE